MAEHSNKRAVMKVPADAVRTDGLSGAFCVFSGQAVCGNSCRPGSLFQYPDCLPEACRKPENAELPILRNNCTACRCGREARYLMVKLIDKKVKKHYIINVL